jgi:Flp pilus assembly protein TadD
MRGLCLLLLVALAGCGSSTMSSLAPDHQSVEMARAAMQGGSPQTALRILADASARSTPSVDALVLQGDALTSLDRYDQAQLAYDQALQRDGNSAGALVGLGRLRLASDPAQAETFFLNAIRADPRNTTALNDLGVARDLQGRHVEAQDAYRRALGINPELSSAVVNMALSLAMTGRGEEGVRLLRPLAEGPNASPKIRHDLAAALTMAGRRTEAQQILSADLSPDDVRKALDAYTTARTGQPLPAAQPGAQPVAQPAR